MTALRLSRQRAAQFLAKAGESPAADQARLMREARRRQRGQIPRRVLAQLRNDGAAMVFRVSKELDSPNVWRAHWRKGHALTRFWERCFARAMGFPADVRIARARIPKIPGRRRVTVTRLVPSTRNFLHDDDDLRFTTKPINDALKRLHLIEDDRRELLEQPMPTQEVSPDGLAWTLVRIETLED